MKGRLKTALSLYKKNIMPRKIKTISEKRINKATEKRKDLRKKGEDAISRGDQKSAKFFREKYDRIGNRVGKAANNIKTSYSKDGKVTPNKKQTALSEVVVEAKNKRKPIKTGVAEMGKGPTAKVLNRFPGSGISMIDNVLGTTKQKAEGVIFSEEPESVSVNDNFVGDIVGKPKTINFKN